MKRLFHQVPDVVHRYGEAHAQHDDAENDGGYIPVDPAECDRDKECDYCACDNKGGSVVGKQTAKRLDYLIHAPKYKILVLQRLAVPFFKPSFERFHAIVLLEHGNRIVLVMMEFPARQNNHQDGNGRHAD